MQKNCYAVTVLIVICIIMSNGCKKPCMRNDYSFENNNSIIQLDKDSIRVGDTLFFTSIIPTTMTDIFGGGVVNYSNAINFASDMGFGELTGLNTYAGAVSSFSIIQQKGNVYTDQNLSPNLVKQLKYVEENGSYKIIFSIVPLRRGIFSLSIADMPSVVRDCDRANIKLKFNPTMHNNLHYLKDIYYGGGQVSPLDSTHTFSFKVY